MTKQQGAELRNIELPVDVTNSKHPKLVQDMGLPGPLAEHVQDLGELQQCGEALIGGYRNRRHQLNGCGQVSGRGRVGMHARRAGGCLPAVAERGPAVPGLGEVGG